MKAGARPQRCRILLARYAVPGGPFEMEIWLTGPEDAGNPLAAIAPQRRRRSGPKKAAYPTYKGRAFADFPVRMKARAIKRKKMLAAWFSTLDAGGSKPRAYEMAREVWNAETKKRITDRMIRRWVGRIKRAGGFGNAPLTAFLDGKSCPHMRARRY
jgi:hypothetical protein